MQIELSFEVQDDYGDDFQIDCSCTLDGNVGGSQHVDSPDDYWGYTEVTDVKYSSIVLKEEPMVNREFKYLPVELQRKIECRIEELT
jgi:hypothetical protein